MHIHNNNGDIQSDTSVKTNNNNNTVNHIYLHTGPNQSEFDGWMRQVGSLLHIAAEHTSIKPVLDLLIAAIEPERIFLHSYPGIAEYNIKGGIELILIIDEINYPLNASFSFVKLSCFKTNNMIVSVHSSCKMEAGLKEGHPYYSTHCREEYLVFSGSRYRLTEATVNSTTELEAEVSNAFHAGINKASELWESANDLEKKASHNCAALMLHQCAEHVYRTILWSVARRVPKTHTLEKLERKAAYYMPQILDVIAEKSSLELLDMVYESQTLPHFKIEDVCDISILSTTVKNLLQASLIIFNDKQNRMFDSGKLKNNTIGE